MSEWPKKKISDIADFQNNKRIPLKNLDREKRQGIYPYYGASGIVDYIDNFIFNGTYLLISEDGENLRTRKTPIAFKADGKFWVNNHAHILSEKEEGILDYLEYYFSRLDLSPYITGAVQPKLNKANLDAIEIPVPPKPERIFINGILNSLTGKIENNRRMNETLEGMAQAIFKGWFVDFDPVKEKIAVLESGGSAEDAIIAAMQAISGMSTEDLDTLRTQNEPAYAELKSTAEAFPSTFTDSPLGPIPEGWDAGTVEDALDLAYGKAMKKTDRTEGNVPVYGSGGINGHHSEFLVTGPGIIVGRKGTVGSIFWEKDNFFPIDTVFYVLPKKPFSLDYLYYLLKILGLENMNTDAAVPGLNRNNVYRLEIVIPDAQILNTFKKIVTNLHESISAYSDEMQTLVMIRDALLPKLLSGEIDVSGISDTEAA